MSPYVSLTIHYDIRYENEKEATDTLRQEMIQIPDETIETVAGGRDRDFYNPRTKK